MTGPSRIAITDPFWLELRKVQLPGIREAGFFDRHYEKPEAFDSLVRDTYFLQFVATNEHSGNFRTFLRFWARLLHYYRTSPRDAKPCGAATLLSLTLLCRCLLKQFAETFSTPELIFQLEQAPCEPAADAERMSLLSADPGRGGGSSMGLPVLITYRGCRVAVRLPSPAQLSPPSSPTAAPARAVAGADSGLPDCSGGSGCGVGNVTAAAVSACLEPFCRIFPEDAELLRCPWRCAFRGVATGETFAAMDVVDRVQELGEHELVVCPCGAPNSRSSVLRSVFREISDFLVSSSFGAVSGAVPSPFAEIDETADGQAAPRNLSAAPHTMRLQAVLLEIVMSLSAVVAPTYGPPDVLAAEQGSTTNRADFCAPFLFLSHQRHLAAAATASREAAKLVNAPSVAAAVDSESGRNGDAGTPRKRSRGKSCDSSSGNEVEDEGPMQSVAHPPAPGETPSLPFLAVLLQVLEAVDEEDGGGGSGALAQPFEAPAAAGARGEPGSTGGSDAPGPLPGGPMGAFGDDTCAGVAPEGDACGARGDCAGSAHHGSGAPGTASGRAEALLASLLNCMWLQPHAASLPRPPQDVLRLLSGVVLPPLGHDRPPLLPDDDAAGDVLPAAADEQAAARAAVSAARDLATNALLVLLLLLFQDSTAHPAVGRAFAGLTDPLLGEAGRRHVAAAAPLNFTQLLNAVLAQLREGLFPLLLYCLVQKNAGFRRYCLCRADADAVLVPMLGVLHALPLAVEGRELAVPPPSATALLLTLLSLTGDRAFCEAASRARLEDGGAVLRGTARPLRDVAVSSLLIIVLLRVAHWNFSSCRDGFFNRAIAGILGNLAWHGVEQLDWHAAARMLEVAQLLARNELKASGDTTGAISAAEQHRHAMVRELLRSLFRLLSACLRVPAIGRNCSLVYALQSVYPASFEALGADKEFGPPLRHMRAVTAWFQAQCPPEGADEGSGGDHAAHTARVEAAAPRLPRAVDTLASDARGPGFAFAETAGASDYFLPVVWRAAGKLVPDHICWSQQRSEGART